MCITEKDLTLDKIKDLSDDKLIKIANVFESRGDWEIKRNFDEPLDIYEVLVDGGEGVYIKIVQFLFDKNFGFEPENFIRYFEYYDDDFIESSPSCDEWAIIMSIINE
jgi:hypothetical protein